MSRRRRATRLYEARTNTRTELSAVPPIAVGWGDLDSAERTALKRLNRGHGTKINDEVLRRLIDLGLAIPRPSGIGITRIGRELVIARLLASSDVEGQ